jgi:hypothetical protein
MLAGGRLIGPRDLHGCCHDFSKFGLESLPCLRHAAYSIEGLLASVRHTGARAPCDCLAKSLRVTRVNKGPIADRRGPYERLGETYARPCGEWLPGSGRELRSVPAFEIYHNAPQFTAPQDLVTDICMALEPR